MAPDSAIVFAYRCDWSVCNKSVSHSNSMFSVPPPAAFWQSYKEYLQGLNQCPESIFIRPRPYMETKWDIKDSEKK